jgi:rhodanese-related sulfurtransferase
VARELKERGFGDVFALRGGFKAWRQAGLPVEEIPNRK